MIPSIAGLALYGDVSASDMYLFVYFYEQSGADEGSEDFATGTCESGFYYLDEPDPINGLSPTAVVVTLDGREVDLLDPDIEPWPEGGTFAFAAYGGGVAPFALEDVLTVPDATADVAARLDADGSLAVTWARASVTADATVVRVTGGSDWVECWTVDTGEFVLGSDLIGQMSGGPLSVTVTRVVGAAVDLGEVVVAASAVSVMGAEATE